MNPIEWLKAIYETFGTPHPRTSMVVVVILGAVSFGAIWHFAAKQVEKSHQAVSAPSKTVSLPTPGAASTTGSQSPAITGDANQVTYGQPPSEKKDGSKR